VQATVHRFDPQTGAGAVLTDSGEVIPFGPDALAGSSLRHLRPGQRLTVVLVDPPDRRAAALRLGSVGVAPPPPR
jgi:cold shock CspA family protein